jgi:hypothetical protein
MSPCPMVKYFITVNKFCSCCIFTHLLSRCVSYLGRLEMKSWPKDQLF